MKVAYHLTLCTNCYKNKIKVTQNEDGTDSSKYQVEECPVCKECWDKEQLRIADEKRKEKMTKEELRQEKKDELKEEINENLAEAEVILEVVLEVLEEKEEILDKFSDFILKRFKSGYREGIDLHVDCLIEAVSKMEEAGIDREDAITLLSSSPARRVA